MLTVVPASGSFYKLIGLPSKALKWLTYEVPIDCRYYQAEDNIGYWYVHEDHLIEIIELAYKQLGAVNYSSVPNLVQMDIARAKENWVFTGSKELKTRNKPTLEDAYRTLHLLPTAPGYLVSAVWKSLARVAHPDRGGNSEKFRKYSEAYNLIKKESE